MTEISFTKFQQKYKFQGYLSEGSFGRVTKVMAVETKKYYALKKIQIKCSSNKALVTNQIQTMAKLSHLPITQIHQFYSVEISCHLTKVCHQFGIIMEIAQGSLANIIQHKFGPRGKPQQFDQVQFLLQIAHIFSQLETFKIAHRDIKPANILYIVENNQKIKWILADFGLAISTDTPSQEQPFAGSVQYASPKLKLKLKNKNSKQECNFVKSDVYSLGITLLETLSGARKYNQKVVQKLIKQGTDQRFLDLFKIMLQEDQQKRPNFIQLQKKVQSLFLIKKQVKSQQKNGLSQAKTQDENQKNQTNTQLTNKRKLFQKKTTCSQTQLQQSPVSIHALSPSSTKPRNNSKQPTQQRNTKNQERSKMRQKSIKAFNPQEMTKKKRRQQPKIQAQLKNQQEKGNKIKIVNVGSCVMTVLAFGSIVACGCDNGSVVFIQSSPLSKQGQNNPSTKLTKMIFQNAHQKQITKLAIDQQNNIWSASLDSSILIWNMQKIAKQLNCPQLKSNPKIQLQKSQFSTTLSVPRNSKGISQLHAHSQTYAIGYNDGHFFIKFKENPQQQGQFYLKIFSAPVTGIRKMNNNFIACSLDGQLKLMEKGDQGQYILSNRFRYFNIPLISMEVLQQGQHTNICLFSYQGHILILNQFLQTICKKTFKSQRLFMEMHTHSKDIFALCQNGTIYDSDDKPVVNTGMDGAFCLSIFSRNSKIKPQGSRANSQQNKEQSQQNTNKQQQRMLKSLKKLKFNQQDRQQSTSFYCPLSEVQTQTHEHKPATEQNQTQKTIQNQKQQQLYAAVGTRSGKLLLFSI